MDSLKLFYIILYYLYQKFMYIKYVLKLCIKKYAYKIDFNKLII
jgi:hypothetical protein